MENNKSHYFYVLLCADNTFYGGYTTDPVRRLAEHNDGIGAKYTRIRSRRPMKMIYTEAFTTRSEAMRAEYAFKQLARHEKERFLKNYLP
ncbi:GIY-YIG nuclease family protein [Vagococcus lutrae]|uniref:GIY-YIG nuclease superfamily protein n=2 Tax=Vagococcus lutrae TaxID=81947 RepID=V6Q2C7_9ENTE|nr:GIY-YIG nuclease family protein [Vagococcus lutrae]EST89371.1 GIY-YIG nuclease superfamily protein [Vagococcus lutrae LBD1]MCO7150796.1 GIY-YIG nuclease family protein [Vagococcus lutrae]MDT2802151.1 GIY-YIG nuclease family protein [Vagococcus lutrae]MDT2806524.1 GIY-YIG nuclease family protein [Vagococcus lutrae]MDT2811629.1 GIY-YIG nuclease family protein [Vagococcus lutrae]